MTIGWEVGMSRVFSIMAAAALLVGCGGGVNQGGSGYEPFPQPSPTPEDAESLQIHANPPSGQAPLDVQFSISASNIPGPYTFQWNFGTLGTSASESPRQMFEAEGSYPVTLTITDNVGKPHTASITILVGNQPQGNEAELLVGDIGYELLFDEDPNESNDTKSTAKDLGKRGEHVIGNAYLHPRNIRYYVDISNAGSVDVVSPFKVDFWVDRLNEPVAGEQSDLTTLVAGLRAGQSKRLYFQWDNALPGSTKAWAIVDAGGQVYESDELNNASSGLDVSVVADEDWYVAEQTQQNYVRVGISDLTVDYDVDVYKGGTFKFSLANPGTEDESRSFYDGNMVGKWSVRVYSPNGRGDTTKPYTITLYPY
jgi:PKD repeat protein